MRIRLSEASLVEQVGALHILHGPSLCDVVIYQVADPIGNDPGVLLILLVATPEFAILRPKIAG